MSPVLKKKSVTAHPYFASILYKHWGNELIIFYKALMCVKLEK